jgi:hypothetical protein
MKHWILRSLAMAVLLAVLPYQALPRQDQSSRSNANEVRLPGGKLQKDEIARAEYEQSLKDAAELADLAQQLKADLEKDTRFVVSLTTIRKTDEIEKLARRIRTRMRRN